MKDLCIQLTDLPDEILLLILKKLTNIEVLYSLTDVNKRLDNIASDPIFTESLTLMTHSSNSVNNTLDNSMLNRFCTEILPNIHSKIKWLNLEPLSMGRILFAVDYPNLHGLTLFNIERETDLRLFDDCAFKNHITTLIITVTENELLAQRSDLMSIVCDRIFSVFMNLMCLKFQLSCEWYVNNSTERLVFNEQPPKFYSSTLMELHANVHKSTDFLYLLDGRFNQLRTFHVNVHYFLDSSSTIIEKGELFNLKFFSLTCRLEILYYDETLIPLLHRMSNLEELFLNLTIDRQILHEPFIDGNNLKNDMIKHMQKLSKFVFSIHSNINHFNYLLHLPSNDDIQHTFKGLEDYQIVSYIHYFPKEKMSQCHIYSYPYNMNSLYRLTNSFPGGLFQSVDKVSLIDEHPFEHEFFIRIAQAFPYLKTLIIDNRSPQIYKQCQQSNENHQIFKIIKYPYLTLLRFYGSHDDYLEQFLDDNKTCLSNHVKLNVHYGSLRRVTNNFTRASTRINCEKIKNIYNIDKDNVPKHFYLYFPHVSKL